MTDDVNTDDLDPDGECPNLPPTDPEWGLDNDAVEALGKCLAAAEAPLGDSEPPAGPDPRPASGKPGEPAT